MKKLDIVFLGMVALLLLGCSSSLRLSQPEREAFANALPVCAVLADTVRYDGQDVLIRGLYRLQPHGPIFYGSACSKEEVGLHWMQNYKENEGAKSVRDGSIALRATTPVDVVYRGRFRVVHGFSCNEVECFLYELDLSELVAAQYV